MGGIASKLKGKSSDISTLGNNPISQEISSNYQQYVLPENLKMNFQFIINKPPKAISKNSSKNSSTNKINEQKTQILIEISKIITNYNKESWKFGNTETLPQFIMKDDAYNAFLNYVTSLLQSPQSTGNPQINFPNKNKNEKIVSEIHNKLVDAGIIGSQINTFFKVNLNELFPDIPKIENDFIYVTLLGLAAIIGAEHLVIYFLMRGGKPNIVYQSENKDTATLMLSYQIALSKIEGSTIPNNYFIILERILYNLYLLGSVDQGVDLSRIYETNYKIQKVNQSEPVIKESILHQLVRIPYSNFYNKPLLNLTIKNGGSIPLLFNILNNNNLGNIPKFWKDINVIGYPLEYTILYSLLMNSTIEASIKLELTALLINKGADPLILPDFAQNSRLKQNISNQNKTDTNLLFIVLQKSNVAIIKPLIEILSTNPQFKQKYEKFMQKTFSNSSTGQQIFTQNQNIQKLISNNQKFKEIYQRLLEYQKKLIVSELIQVPNITKKLQNQSLQNSSSQPNSTKIQSAGKQIQMRTYHFLKSKKYSERAFTAERPIIAADNAYDFMKLHYNIGDKQVTFTIHDRMNNKKYKYIAKTLKDGKNLIKTAK